MQLMVRSARSLVVVLAGAILVSGVVRAAGDPPLVDAARDGDLGRVEQLLASGESPDLPAGDGSTPLLWAAYGFGVDTARALIAAGADVDRANNYGITPLLQASRTGDAGMIRLLLEAGADPGLAHTDGSTPLMAAARSGSLESVELLISGGADVDASDSYQEQTALMWAAAEGHAGVVGRLLEAGADPDRQARVSTIESRRNADHPTGGFSALMWAARNGHEGAVRRLVEGGADLDLENGDGASAAMIAIYNDRFDLAATLIELGSDVDDGSLYTAVEMRSATTDQFAFDGSRLRPNHENTLTSLDLIALLLERGADPHRWFEGQFHSTSMPNSDRFANTPFFRAAAAADVEALRLFLDYVGDIDQVLVVPMDPSENGGTEPDAPTGGRGRGNANADRTATMAALAGGRAPAMTGGPGYIRSGDPPWREPGSRAPEDAVRLLLEAGASPDVTDPDGVPLLHLAVRAGNLEVVRALGEAGADFLQTDADGLTALDVAEGRRPGGEEPEGRGGGPGRGGRGGGNGEAAALLRELMGLPPAPEATP